MSINTDYSSSYKDGQFTNPYYQQAFDQIQQDGADAAANQKEINDQQAQENSI